MESKSSNKLLIVIAVILVLAGIGGVAYALSRGETEQKSSSDQTAEEMGMTEQEHANMDEATNETSQEEAVITFTNDGFDKSTYTFPAGKAITVKNESSMDMQFSSDDHPTHREHPELNMKVLGAGESGTLTPPGKGTYAFHDHINDQFTGTIIVE